MMELGKIIAKLRAEKGLNQRELANLLGVSNGAVGMWETGKRQPDLELIVKMADLFDVSTDYLLGRESEKKSNVPKDETEELLNYYNQLNTMQRRWVMGQIVDLLFQLNEYSAGEKSVAADKKLMQEAK